MGRPLARRFFGNENSNDSGDNRNTWGTVSNGGTAAKPGEGIAGDAVASVTLSALGSYTTRPTVQFSAPNLAGVGGVTATGTVTSRAKTASVTASGTIAYINGEVVSSTGGTTWTVTIEGEQSVTITDTDNSGAGGTARIKLSGTITAIKGANFLTGSSITGGGLSPSTQYYIKTGGTSDTFEITDTYAKAVAGTGITLTGAGAVTNGSVGIGSVYAPVASVVVANKGSFEALVSGAQSTTSVTGSGAGMTITISAYEASSVVITDPGSGYTTAADAAPTFTQSVTGTSVLTVDTGTPYSADAFNTIIVYAQTTEGGSNLVGDIIKQENTQRYKVKTADGTAYCNLVTHTPNAIGEVMIKATDSNNATYYVMKLNSRKATIYPYGGGTHLFPLQGENSDQPQQVHWTFTTGDPTYDSATTVIIENA